MKRKGLYLLVALAVAGVGAAHAQSMDDTTTNSDNSSQVFDGRWYIAPTIGGMYNDTDRLTSSHQIYWGLAVGKFVNPHFSLEMFADSTLRDRDPQFASNNWTNVGVGVSARFFPGEVQAWRPYLMVGALGTRYHVAGEDDWVAGLQGGFGVQGGMGDSTDLRIELAYRYAHNDDTFPNHNGYGDFMLGFTLISKIGDPPAPPEPVAPPPPPEPAPPSCSELDDDGDGVNNCMDQCPTSEAGSIIGPDGCYKTVVIDLQGVHFKFDRPQPGETDIADTLQEAETGMSILDQAIATLKRYPAVKVELAGYTDFIGSEAYNQELSERRAQIVYHYLTSNGLDADRIIDVEGFGESHPIATAKTDDARARNRRTELQVQNPEQPMTKK